MQSGNLVKHDQVQHQLADYLWENIPGLEGLLIISKDGNVIEHRTVPLYDQVYNIEWLKHIGNLISVRFQTGDFRTQLGGLDMTVNIFKEKAVLVSMLRTGHILTMIIPRTANFDRLGHILSNYKRPGLMS